MNVALRLIALLFALPWAAPAPAADAAACLHRCSAACYTRPNPGACEQSCNAQCVNRSDPVSQHCGSIVVADGRNPSIGWSWGTPDQASAERQGWQECMKNASGCRPVITFCDQCAAVARAWEGASLLGSFGSRRNGPAEAERAALTQCQERFPQAACRTAIKVCAARGPA